MTLQNGRQSKQFLRDDLPKIIRSVELNLQQNSLTAAEINKRFQNILLSCASAASDSQDNLQENSNDEHEHELKTLSSAVQNVREIRQFQHKEKNSQSVTKYDCQQNQSTENNDVIIVEQSKETNHSCDCLKSVNDKIDILTDTVQRLCVQIEEHITESSLKYGELRDAITSLNKQYKVYTQDLHSEVEAVNKNTQSVDRNIQSVNEGLLRKLKSVSDTLKAQKQLNTEHKSLNTAKPQKTNYEKNFPKVQKCTHNHLCNDSANLQKQISDSEKSSSPAEQFHSESETALKPKTRTLIIGDSILKGISKRGLEAHVDIR